MKTKTNNKNVAHLWAHKAQSHASGSNMYFEGDTIYSYGGHFPIARHYQTVEGAECILFTNRGYSNSTSKHIQYTRQALRNDTRTVFYVINPGNTPSVSDVGKMVAAIIDNRKVAMGCRVGLEYKAAIATSSEIALKNFGKAFNLKTPSVKDSKWVAFLATIEEKILEEKTKQEAKEAIQAERRRIAAIEQDKRNSENLKDWLNGNNVHLYGGHYSFLRIMPCDTETVETSNGANVPLDHVKKVLPLVLSLINSGKAWKRNGHTIHLGNYKLDQITESGEVIAGCHHFAKEEILRFAASI